MVQQSIKDIKTSGSDRPVVWDGTGGKVRAFVYDAVVLQQATITTSSPQQGPEQETQLKNIQAAKQAPGPAAPSKPVAGPHPPPPAQQPDAKRQKTQ